MLALLELIPILERLFQVHYLALFLVAELQRPMLPIDKRRTVFIMEDLDNQVTVELMAYLQVMVPLAFPIGVPVESLILEVGMEV